MLLVSRARLITHVWTDLFKKGGGKEIRFDRLEEVFVAYLLLFQRQMWNIKFEGSRDFVHDLTAAARGQGEICCPQTAKKTHKMLPNVCLVRHLIGGEEEGVANNRFTHLAPGVVFSFFPLLMEANANWLLSWIQSDLRMSNQSVTSPSPLSVPPQRHLDW